MTCVGSWQLSHMSDEQKETMGQKNSRCEPLIDISRALQETFRHDKRCLGVGKNTDENLMSKMLQVYGEEITMEQAIRLMRDRKQNDRSWAE